MATSHGIKLDPQTHERLKQLGAKRDRSPHWLMREAIKQYLNKEEAYEHEKTEDQARWETYLLTGKAMSNDEVETWLQELSNKHRVK